MVPIQFSLLFSQLIFTAPSYLNTPPHQFLFIPKIKILFLPVSRLSICHLQVMYGIKLDLFSLHRLVEMCGRK